MYLEDPWTLPSPRTSDEDPIPTKIEMSLYLVEIAYQATLDPFVYPIPSSLRTKEEDTFAHYAWVVASSRSHECFDDIFPSN